MTDALYLPVCPEEAVSDGDCQAGLGPAAAGNSNQPHVDHQGAPAPAIRKTVLENGVRVVTESVAGVRSVSIAVLVDCGSKDESADQAGLSHLCEHLSFQGTSSRSATQIARQADTFGHVGGFTTRDYTCYYAATVDDYQFHALDLLGDVLLNSTFPDDCLSREKQAILHEIERGGDLPDQLVHDLAKRSSWPESALGRPIAGDAAAIAGHTREELIYFFHSHYTADRMIIAAAGNLDHDDFVAQTRDAFWRLVGRSEPSARQIPRFQPGVSIAPTNSAQAYFCLTIPAPSYADPDRYVTHVLDRIIGGGISSRLLRKLREEAGLVYAVQSQYHAYRDAGMILVEGSTGAEHLAETVAILLETLANLLSGQDPVDAEELWRAKTHMRVQHLTSSEDVHTRMCRLATQELYFESHLDTGKILAHIEAVELGHIAAFNRNYLSRQFSQAHLAIAGPIEDEQALRSQLNRLMNEFAWLQSTEAMLAEPVSERVEFAEPASEKAELAQPVTEQVVLAEPASERVESAEPVSEKVELAQPVTEQAVLAEPVSERVEFAEPASEKAELAQPVTEQVVLAEPVSEKVELAQPVTEQAVLAEPVSERVEFAEPASEKAELAQPVTEQATPAELVSEQVPPVEPVTQAEAAASVTEHAEVAEPASEKAPAEPVSEDAPPDDPSRDMLAEAVELAQQGRKVEARWLLHEVCHNDPGNAKAWLWRASVAGAMSEAIACLDQVLALEPDNSTARKWLERLRPPMVEVVTYHCFLCAYEGAEEFTRCPKCRSILSLDLNAIFHNEGVDVGQVRSAVGHFQSLAGSVDPFDLEYFLGMAQLNLLNSEAALRHFRKAAQMDQRGAKLSEAITALSRRPLIVAVDDCLTIRVMVATTLERNGYRCLSVSGSLEALASLEKDTPDFILLDVSMPVMDGYALCKTIKGRANTKRTTIVMLSGQDGFFDKVKGRLAGASDYLTKPIEPAVLLRVVRKYIHA